MKQKLGCYSFEINGKELGIPYIDEDENLKVIKHFSREELPEHLKPLFDALKKGVFDKLFFINGIVYENENYEDFEHSSGFACRLGTYVELITSDGPAISVTYADDIDKIIIGTTFY